MPPRVAARPRSAGGLPVPFVAAWEGEEEYSVQPCPWSFGKPAVFPKRTLVDVTRPVFGLMDPSRQREVAFGVRCQVCHIELGPMTEQLEPGRQFQWLVDMRHEPRTMRGRQLVLEPWVCDDCLVYALQVCPGLVGAKRQRPNLLAVFAANLVGVTIVPHGNLEGHPPCGGYHKIEPLAFHRVRATTLLSYGDELRPLLTDDPPRKEQR
jgi:hypothetical protein